MEIELREPSETDYTLQMVNVEVYSDVMQLENTSLEFKVYVTSLTAFFRVAFSLEGLLRLVTPFLSPGTLQAHLIDIPWERLPNTSRCN